MPNLQSINIGGGSSSSSTPSLTTSFSLVDDFSLGFYSGSSGQIYGEHTWASIQTGTPAFTCNGSSIPSDSSHVGVLQITVTANNDGGAIAGGNYNVAETLSFAIGNGSITMESLIYISTLSNGTDNGEIAVGFRDAPIWSASNNGWYLQYEYEVSNNWQLLTIASGTATTTTSSTPVATGWHHIKVVSDAAGANVYGYVDGVLVATNTTNIPTAKLPSMICYRKTAGSSAINLGIDYINITKAFTTAR